MKTAPFRVWLSGREMLSYREGALRCDMCCMHPVENFPWTVYLEDVCYENGAKRKLSPDEITRVEQRVRDFLSVRKFFGFNVGRCRVDVIKSQTHAA